MAAQIAAVREGLASRASSRATTTSRGSSRPLRERLAEHMDPDAQASFEQAAPPDQLYQGLERYWRKRAEAEAAA